LASSPVQVTVHVVSTLNAAERVGNLTDDRDCPLATQRTPALEKRSQIDIVDERHLA
jgi:hypothetical protein